MVIDSNTTSKYYDGTGEEKQQQEDILAKLLRLVQDNHQEPDTEPDASLTNTIKVLQQCLDFKNQNSEMFKKMATESERNLTLQKNFVVTSGNNEKKKKDPLITVTGTKNAQLICIKDENSIVSDVEESVKNIFPQNSPRKATIHVDVQSSSSEVMEEQGVANQPSRMNIKISRINISKKMLKLLPKEYVINVIQHKLMFHKQSKDNYMYRKSSTGKPWELFEKISDEILDFALLGIVKEIEVNELLENIYNAEFQY